MARRTPTTTKGAKKKLAAPKKARGPLVVVNPAYEGGKTKASASFATFMEAYDRVGLAPDQQETFERLQKKYTSSSTWVFVCVIRIAQAMAGTPFQIVRKDKEFTAAAVEKGPARGLRDLLANPNPFQSRYDFIENIGVSLELTGNAFVEKAEMENRLPGELYVLDPAAMTVIPDRKKKIAGYILTANGKQIKYAPDEIIHIKYPHPTNVFYGLSPLTAAKIAIDIDQGALEWNHNFMNRGGWPAGAIETPNEVGKDEYRRLKNEIKAYVQGGKRTAGRIMLLTGGMKYSKIAVTPKDMDWLSARRFSRDEILSIFGVPFAIAGLFSTEQTTARSAGVREQIRTFYQSNIYPKLDGKILGAFNRDLVPAFNANLKLRPDLQRVPAMQEDMERDYIRAQTFKVLVTSGWSINSALGELYPHIPSFTWGDVYWVNNTMIPVDGPDNPVADAASKKPAAPAGGGGNEEGKDIASRLGINSGDEKAVERLLSRVIGDDEEDVLKKLVAQLLANDAS
jgi:HK97 family phage portal protein